MIDERTLELISNCWVKFRHVMHVSQLCEDCKHVMCVFLLKIAEDDKEFADDLDLKEDVEYCERLEKVTVPGVI
ncbi:hypothetical protein [Sulfuracidifex tepidarius]|uniref:Uncharacterized protein n=1 Tax=Sulfuracidifex tepidarius TaxID=1294262 RepID=A0A510DVC3_9CREN|nr:hypothetical protein [Sulfuracidifex tepidarius]BBG24124.1 hypothetical protein IC006_1426 [Sulfuracidifex tepidarius]BBG26880.1 hypothetical protein IC007_1402 [Sulfuracidifex tepidarius]